MLARTAKFTEGGFRTLGERNSTGVTETGSLSRNLRFGLNWLKRAMQIQRLLYADDAITRFESDANYCRRVRLRLVVGRNVVDRDKPMAFFFNCQLARPPGPMPVKVFGRGLVSHAFDGRAR